jgi:hypothetical protein
MRSGFRLPSPPQKKFPSRRAGSLLFCRLSESLGFFRKSLLKTQLFLDAPVFHALLPRL